MGNAACIAAVIPTRSRAMACLAIVALCIVIDLRPVSANQKTSREPDQAAAPPGCLTQKVAEEELLLFAIDGGTVPVYLVRQSRSIRLGRITPTHTAEIVVVTAEDWLAVIKDAAPSRAAARRGTVSHESSIKMHREALISSLSKADFDDYARTTLVDDALFQVDIGGRRYSVQVNTHDIKAFAEITVCRVH